MKIDQHAWNRGGVWDAYFAVVLAATLLIVLTGGGSLASRAVAALSLAATAPLYAEVLAQAASEEQEAAEATAGNEDLGLEDDEDLLEPEGGAI